MRISPQRLVLEAEETGFEPEMLEKVIYLLGLLEQFTRHPFLSERLALKGGIAVNLFTLAVPRLSVDIDLNYVGKVDREGMLDERPRIEQAIQAVCSREDFAIRRKSKEHAGGKWTLGFESAFGQTGSLGVDLNFMFRLPLWALQTLDSKAVGSYLATGIRVLDIHEITAGKLAALLSRGQARDVYDAHQLLGLGGLDRERLRAAFVVYGGMNRRDWRTVSAQDVSFEPEAWERQLGPLLRTGAYLEDARSGIDGSRLVEECRDALGIVLPFIESERRFLDLLLDQGQIEPSLLTTDRELQERIRQQPLLEWKAINVRKHKGVI